MAATISVYAQYPTIPDSVKQRGAEEEQRWDALNAASWRKALPDVIDGMLTGKTFVPQASRPSALKPASIPAFPGAEGGGMYSFGGRGVNWLGASVQS